MEAQLEPKSCERKHSSQEFTLLDIERDSASTINFPGNQTPTSSSAINNKSREENKANESKSNSDDYLERLSSELSDLSVATSSKAKSAPTTPCNTTPVAFYHYSTGHPYQQILHDQPEEQNNDQNHHIERQQHQYYDQLNIYELEHQQQQQLIKSRPAASTLPTDIRRSVLAPVLAGAPHSALSVPSQEQHRPLRSQEEQARDEPLECWSRARLEELMQLGKRLLDAKDHAGAVRELSRCIQLATRHNDLEFLKQNFRLLGKRAEAHFALGNLNEAIEDARAARDLNPRWAQAYYLQGRAQFLLGQCANALAAFAFGLAQQEQPEATNLRLLEALVDAALNCKLKGLDFETKYHQLETANQHKKAFVVVAVLGQALLGIGLSEHAAIMLESALRLATSAPDSRRLRASIASSLAYAYCALRDYEKAVGYLQKELDLESELEQVEGQCRVLGHLGHVYYKLRNYDKSIESHRAQMNLAIKAHLLREAALALDAAGHVHSAMGNYVAALTSHGYCLHLMKHYGEQETSQLKQLLAICHIQTLLGDFSAAEEKRLEAQSLLQTGSQLKRSNEFQLSGLVMIQFELAHLALRRQAYNEAKQHYQWAYELASRPTRPASSPTANSNGTSSTGSLGGRGSACGSVAGNEASRQKRLLQARALMGLGHVHRLLRQPHEARDHFERELELARQLGPEPSNQLSQALCNLALTYQQLNDLPKARKLLEDNFELSDDSNSMRAFAFSYLANQNYLEGKLEEAQVNLEKSLALFNELSNCASERKLIEKNLAIICERLRQQAPPIDQSTTTLANNGNGSHSKRLMVAN